MTRENEEIKNRTAIIKRKRRRSLNEADTFFCVGEKEKTFSRITPFDIGLLCVVLLIFFVHSCRPNFNQTISLVKVASHCVVQIAVCELRALQRMHHTTEICKDDRRRIVHAGY
jgi:hypothetical protein